MANQWSHHPGRRHQPGALPTGLSALDAAKRAQDGHCRRIVSVPGGTIDSVKDEPTDDEQATMTELLKRMTELASAMERPDANTVARINLVQTLLNHNDFITIR